MPLHRGQSVSPNSSLPGPPSDPSIAATPAQRGSPRRRLAVPRGSPACSAYPLHALTGSSLRLAPGFQCAAHFRSSSAHPSAPWRWPQFSLPHPIHPDLQSDSSRPRPSLGPAALLLRTNALSPLPSTQRCSLNSTHLKIHAGPRQAIPEETKKTAALHPSPSTQIETAAASPSPLSAALCTSAPTDPCSLKSHGPRIPALPLDARSQAVHRWYSTTSPQTAHPLFPDLAIRARSVVQASSSGTARSTPLWDSTPPHSRSSRSAATPGPSSATAGRIFSVVPFPWK